MPLHGREKTEWEAQGQILAPWQPLRLRETAPSGYDLRFVTELQLMCLMFWQRKWIKQSMPFCDTYLLGDGNSQCVSKPDLWPHTVNDLKVPTGCMVLHQGFLWGCKNVKKKKKKKETCRPAVQTCTTKEQPNKDIKTLVFYTMWLYKLYRTN